MTLFTRLEGKVRGVARAAKKSRRRFGGALEPLTYVKLTYDDRERQELVRLDACEVIDSPLTSEVSYPRAVALGHVAELLDELSPDREANDAVFRLALSVLAQLKGQDFWQPITYFDLWMARLMGYLPDVSECLTCGRALNGSRAYFHALADGLVCLRCRLKYPVREGIPCMLPEDAELPPGCARLEDLPCKHKAPVEGTS